MGKLDAARCKPAPCATQCLPQPHGDEKIARQVELVTAFIVCVILAALLNSVRPYEERTKK